jgi:sugar phosphate isomerase/epimerase
MRYGTLLRITDIAAAKDEFLKLKARGFDCCHLVYKPEKYTKEAAEIIIAASKESGIEVEAIFAGFRDNYTKWNISTDYLDAGINSKKYGSDRIEYLKQAAQFAKWIGTENMLIHGGFVANNPYSDEYLYTLGLYRELALFLKELGLNLLLETGGESPVTLLRLITEAGCDNIYVNLDTANVIMYGYGNPVDATHTLSTLIKSVHVKDGVPPTSPYELGSEVDFGTGFANFDRVFEMLKAISFSGPLIIEREIPDGKQEEKINQTLNTLKEIWK